MSKPHPLEEQFDLDPAQAIKNIFGMELNIPDDPTLQTVVKLALDQYKHMVQEAMLLEPENRLPTLDLAKEFLNIAKDAMHKESDLQIKHKNAEAKMIGRRSPKDLPPAEGGGSSREDLLKRKQEMMKKGKG